MCLGRVGYLSICGCSAEGPPCDSLPADGDCEEEASGVVVAPPMESQHYALWVKQISRKRQLAELPD